MLAKIFKDQSSIAIAPFVVPDMSGKAPTIGVTEFQFPTAPFEFKETDTFQNTGDITTAAAPEVSEILARAEIDAAAILAAAEAQSEIIEQAARDKGLAAARATIDQEVAAQVVEMRQQLADTIENVSNLYAQVAARAENEIVQLSLEIARKVVSHEVKIDREIALALARVSLGRLHNRVAAFVHLHPEDFAYVSAHREKLGFHGSLELVEDRSINLGGCLVRTENGDVDARIESQFEEISRGLLG